MNPAMKEKIAWSAGGAALLFIVALLIGGIYTVTPANGPVDTAYKINRFTGKVSLSKHMRSRLERCGSSQRARRK